MQPVDLVLSDHQGKQWGVFRLDTPCIPRQGEYIHYLSEEDGNAVFHVLFVQYVAEAKGIASDRQPARLTRVPYVHVEISDDDEPWLSGTLRGFAEGLKQRGVQLHQRDKLGY